MTEAAENTVSGVPELGSTLAGKYQLERVLGRGGMGIVFAAKHLTLGGSVAVKVLSSEAAKNPVALTRFQREGRVAAKIRGEHVAEVHDVDVLPDGTPYIVMELLEGNDLVEEQRQGNQLPLDEVLSYVLQTCEAVACAHAAGIVHRDLKPGNLFLARQRDGTRVLKVLDFGISKMIEPDLEDAEQLTVTTAFEALGSPVYMSPEQMRSTRDVDHRTDIWSLGVLLFKLLTGEVPFPGKTIPDVCARILVDETPSIRGARSDVPEVVDAVIRRCLSKSPQDRFQSVGELAAALGPAVALPERARIERILKIESPADGRVLSTSDRVSIPGSDFRHGDVPTIIGPAETPPEPAPEQKSPTWIIGVGVALLLVVALYALLGHAPTAPAEAATKPTTTELGTPPAAAHQTTPVVDEPKPASPSVPVPPLPSAAASSTQSSPNPAKAGPRPSPRHVASSGPVAAPAPAPAPAPKASPAGDEHPLHL